MDLSKLLYFYFPRELPPTFTTRNFALAMGAFKSNPFSNLPKRAMLVKHEIPRHGLNRRVMGIPNPIFHYHLCLEIYSNWNTIDQIYQGSNISRSSPRFMENASEDEKNTRLQKLNTRSLASYILITDISRLYPSVYTHSIPWAIHTKAIAKKSRKTPLLGNNLDKFIRDGQDNQTIGIPIGPYTSLVISEIILSVIDAELQKSIPKLKGVRRIDDFELGFKTYAEAEACLMELSFLLRGYELEINQLKTEIIKLPTHLDHKWVQDIRKFDLEDENDSNIQKRVLLAYFDEVLTLLQANSTEHVLNYALSKLIKIKISSKNYKIVQDFLFQCLMIDTSTFLRVLILLQSMFPHDLYKSTHKIDYAVFGELLHHQIIYNSNLKRGNEVAWALWAAIYWKIPINELAAQALSKVEDSVVALMVLHARSLKLIKNGLDTRLWETQINEQGLYGSQWLLAYEANMQGWLTSKIDYVSNDPLFKILKQEGIKFYNTSGTTFNLNGLVQPNIDDGDPYSLSDDVNTNI